MPKIIMALDQGTSSSRTILFDEKGKMMASAGASFECLYPKPGWVEQRPQDLWDTIKRTMFEALRKAKINVSQVTAVGITNQRETVIAWNRDTGEPLYNAIVWQCRRTSDFCSQLKSEGFEQVIRKKTGLVADPYFSGTKMWWILKNVDKARKLADKGKLCFGTVDSWLIWNLTHKKVHAIDSSNASRTMVYNIFEQKWDEEILKRFEIPIECLPQVVPSSGILGSTDKNEFGAAIPIAGDAGDQQASLFGHACFDAGMAKNTYGTGCFMLLNTGKKPVPSKHGLLTTIAWRIGKETTYANEGSVFMGGALIQWLRDEMNFFKNSDDTEKMARSVENSGGVYVVPAFVGLGAPYWDPYARGCIVGLTRGTTKKHIVRAALEAICYQSADLGRAMEKDIGHKIKSLRVDGGATRNNFLCQFQADTLQLTVSRPKILETTALGTAFLAGLATGVWKDMHEIEKLWKEDQAFTPTISKQELKVMLKGWHRAVKRSQGWAK